MPFLCEISVTDKLEFVDIDKLRLCQLDQIQKPYNCRPIEHSRGKFLCMTVLQHPKSRQEANEFSAKSNGKLSTASSYDIKRVLKHILALNGNSIKNNSLFLVGDEKYVEIDWSNEPDFAIAIKISQKMPLHDCTIAS